MFCCSGCPWRLLPKSRQFDGAQRYFALWRDGGLWTSPQSHASLMAAREPAGKKVK